MINVYDNSTHTRLWGYDLWWYIPLGITRHVHKNKFRGGVRNKFTTINITYIIPTHYCNDLRLI